MYFSNLAMREFDKYSKIIKQITNPIAREKSVIFTSIPPTNPHIEHGNKKSLNNLFNLSLFFTYDRSNPI